MGERASRSLRRLPRSPREKRILHSCSKTFGVHGQLKTPLAYPSVTRLMFSRAAHSFMVIEKTPDVAKEIGNSFKALLRLAESFAQLYRVVKQPNTARTINRDSGPLLTLAHRTGQQIVGGSHQHEVVSVSAAQATVAGATEVPPSPAVKPGELEETTPEVSAVARLVAAAGNTHSSVTRRTTLRHPQPGTPPVAQQTNGPKL